MNKNLVLYTTVMGALLSSAYPAQGFAADAANGKAKFATLCASCHGEKGLGDGPVAAALPPEMKPANLEKGAFKYATDETKFKELLQKGGAAVGLNPLMPAQAGLVDADISDLYAFVHSLKK